MWIPHQLSEMLTIKYKILIKTSQDCPARQCDAATIHVVWCQTRTQPSQNPSRGNICTGGTDFTCLHTCFWDSFAGKRNVLRRLPTSLPAFYLKVKCWPQHLSSRPFHGRGCCPKWSWMQYEIKKNASQKKQYQKLNVCCSMIFRLIVIPWRDRQRYWYQHQRQHFFPQVYINTGINISTDVHWSIINRIYQSMHHQSKHLSVYFTIHQSTSPSIN